MNPEYSKMAKDFTRSNWFFQETYDNTLEGLKTYSTLVEVDTSLESATA